MEKELKIYTVKELCEGLHIVMLTERGCMV